MSKHTTYSELKNDRKNILPHTSRISTIIKLDLYNVDMPTSLAYQTHLDTCPIFHLVGRFVETLGHAIDVKFMLMTHQEVKTQCRNNRCLGFGPLGVSFCPFGCLWLVPCQLRVWVSD